MKEMKDIFWCGLFTGAHHLAGMLERGGLFEQDEARIEVGKRGRLHYSIAFRRLAPPSPGLEPWVVDAPFWKDLREYSVSFANMLENADLFDADNQARTQNGQFWGRDRLWNYDITVRRMDRLEGSRRRRMEPTERSRGRHKRNRVQ